MKAWGNAVQKTVRDPSGSRVTLGLREGSSTTPMRMGAGYSRFWRNPGDTMFCPLAVVAFFSCVLLVFDYSVVMSSGQHALELNSACFLQGMAWRISGIFVTVAAGKFTRKGSIFE